MPLSVSDDGVKSTLALPVIARDWGKIVYCRHNLHRHHFHLAYNQLGDACTVWKRTSHPHFMSFHQETFCKLFILHYQLCSYGCYVLVISFSWMFEVTQKKKKKKYESQTSGNLYKKLSYRYLSLKHCLNVLVQDICKSQETSLLRDLIL
jgi:hypothetical protein